MAAYEYVRPDLVKQFTGCAVPFAGVASDMGHGNLEALAFEHPDKRVLIQQASVVDIAADRNQRLELRERGGELEAAAYIPRMPQLIDRGKEVTDRLVEDSVGIGYEPYVLHARITFMEESSPTLMIWEARPVEPASRAGSTT